MLNDNKLLPNECPLFEHQSVIDVIIPPSLEWEKVGQNLQDAGLHPRRAICRGQHPVDQRARRPRTAVGRGLQDRDFTTVVGSPWLVTSQ